MLMSEWTNDSLIHPCHFQTSIPRVPLEIIRKKIENLNLQEGKGLEVLINYNYYETLTFKNINLTNTSDLPAETDRSAAKVEPQVELTHRMTKDDTKLREPLLSFNKENEKEEQDVEMQTNKRNYKTYMTQEARSSDATQETIDVEMIENEENECNLPPEILKTLFAFVIMIFNLFITLLSLSVVHDLVPDRNLCGPLPDTFLSHIEEIEWALSMSEYIILVSASSTTIILIFHRYKWIIFRRVFLMMSLLYLYRGVTMFITVVPIASVKYYCSPKAPTLTAKILFYRIFYLMSGVGLSINGKHTFCGDYIYSGHTVILVFSYLCISEYVPKKFTFVRIIYALMAVVGILLVLLGHGHYSIDVLIAYYITTRLFWTYHTLANNESLKKKHENNYIAREWWFVVFCYFESKVTRPIPCQFQWPLPWPKRFRR